MQIRSGFDLGQHRRQRLLGPDRGRDDRLPAVLHVVVDLLVGALPEVRDVAVDEVDPVLGRLLRRHRLRHRHAVRRKAVALEHRRRTRDRTGTPARGRASGRPGRCRPSSAPARRPLRGKRRSGPCAAGSLVSWRAGSQRRRARASRHGGAVPGCGRPSAARLPNFATDCYRARMGTMNISLPDTLKSFVDEQVRSRGYGTSSEYVRELIRQPGSPASAVPAGRRRLVRTRPHRRPGVLRSGCEPACADPQGVSGKPVRPREMANLDVEEAVAHYRRTAGEKVVLGLIDALVRTFSHIARHPASGSPRYAPELAAARAPMSLPQ